MKLKVSSTNFYVKNPHPYADAQFLTSYGIDFGGIQEGHSGNAEAIKRAIRHNYTTYWKTSDNKDLQLAYLDVPIIVSHRLRILKTWARQLSQRAEVRNIGAPRAATATRVIKEGKKITFINTHLNAGVQNVKTKQPLSTRIRRVAEYVKSMVILEIMIRRAQARGDLVVLTGDLNFSEQKSGVWKFSPQALFKRTGLRYKNHHLDYIAYSKAFTAGILKIIPTTKTGSDHPWLILDLTI